MASRVIHLAISEEIIKQVKLKDNNKFLIGSLLPDAAKSGQEDRHKTHFVKILQDKDNKTFDFSQFLKYYGGNIHNDDLYLGYYIHLIEDALFRKLAFEKWNLLKKKNDLNYKENLYNDYKILNKYLIKKYKLNNKIQIPEDLKLHSINKIYSFDFNTLLIELEKDFKEDIQDQKLAYLELDLVDVFISECITICIKEINSILSNKETTINSDDYAWKIKEDN